ncbi:group 1 glycosyl transferase [Nostoc carneum NIES-2107]|nr:group 1 glycosyl transferase [Nostoc carneum NIES-2107]
MSIDINSSQKFVQLHIIVSLASGGGQRMLYNLLLKTNRLRFEPIVISLMDRGIYGDRIEALDIPVYTLGMKARMLPTPAIIWRLIHTIHQLKPNIIQGWMYHGNLAAQLASIFSWRHIPVVWSIHHSINPLAADEKIIDQGFIRFCSLTANFTDWVVFVARNSKIQHEALGYCCDNSCVIPNGFDTSLFKPSNEARLSVREELSLSPESFIIGSLARYDQMKDHANFLRSAALLVKDFPEVHFLLAGNQVEPENQSLYQLIQDLGIVERIHLLGERRDIPRLSAALDILTSSSAYGEAFPLVVGEAMSCGVPCVVTDVGDSAWIVGNTGRVVPPRNSEALANAWKDLIELGLEDREALGRAARARIIEHFSLDSIVDQYENLYESFLIKKHKYQSNIASQK